MPRNLDLTAVRSFVTVADTGGVTRAASQLHLTQSAVSMQLKRLEEALGQPLLDRSGRGVTLTAQGEQLLSYGRRILALNDEVWGKMTDQLFEGEITFGVPHDIVYPHVPAILQHFAAEYPRVKVQLISSYTRRLKDLLARGEIDLILTTEDLCDPGGETLCTSPLIWFGAPGGQAWRARPLRLAFENACIFRGPVQAALDAVDIPWEMAVTSESTRTIEATVSADLAVHAGIDGSLGHYLEPIRHAGALPALPTMQINLYTNGGTHQPLVEALATDVRRAFQSGERAAA
ncbi:MAG: LysR family transcriptional regulator [Pseudomonadota bacterium]